MNCKKVRRLLPLLVGGDLLSKKSEAVLSHIEKCPKCKQEFSTYDFSIKKIKHWLGEDQMDWPEFEWKKAIQEATKEKKTSFSPSFAPWPFKTVWAYVLMAAFGIALALFVIKPSPFKQRIGLEFQEKISKDLVQESAQEVVSMTIVSKESGLKIVWFFNKNFDLEVKK